MEGLVVIVVVAWSPYYRSWESGNVRRRRKCFAEELCLHNAVLGGPVLHCIVLSGL